MDDLEGNTGLLKPRTGLAKETEEEAYIRAAITYLASTDGLCGISNKRTSNTDIRFSVTSSQSIRNMGLLYGAVP